jgi:hypothetical protein
MSDKELLKWGVRPLPREERQGVRASRKPPAQPASPRGTHTPTPPVGGSAVPAPKSTETKRGA